MDSLNERAWTLTHTFVEKRKKSLVFDLSKWCIELHAIHLSFTNMICWHAKCRFGTHTDTQTYTKGTLYYSTILILSTMPNDDDDRCRAISTLFETDCVYVCVCVRTRLNISPKIKQTPASNVFFFLFTMLAINWAHPYNHREEKRLFNLFFVLLFNLSMWCCWFVRRTHIYLFLKEKESEIEKSERERRKKQQKMANLFFYLMKKRDISHFQTKFVQFF